MKGAAVVDPDHDLASIFKIRYLYLRGQGQGLVGRRHGIHVEDLTVRSLPAVKLMRIVGGASDLVGAAGRNFAGI